jgi:hypothetical protein
MAYDYEKERGEAIEAGERTLDSLEEALDCPENAGNWGALISLAEDCCQG